MDVNRWANGNFVIHKILGGWKGHASAWFKKDGTMYDCEQVLRPFRTRPIKMGGPIWRELELIGKCNVEMQEENS
jgi:hypothetical protein